jgi:hypothetical protein
LRGNKPARADDSLAKSGKQCTGIVLVDGLEFGIGKHLAQNVFLSQANDFISWVVIQS